MKSLLFRSVSLALVCASFAAAQPADDTKLRQVIIFSRHSVRAPVAPNDYLNGFSVRKYPLFTVAPGILTDNGIKLETLVGGYFRQWLTKEGLLTGKDTVDAGFTYVRANILERTRTTAQSFASGLLPGASITVNWQQQGSDPLFDPVGAGVAVLDQRKAIAAVVGRLGGNPQSLAAVYAPELSSTRALLLNYPAGQTPAPPTPAGLTDVTAIPIAVTAGSPGSPVTIEGLTPVGLAVDPFIMQYADGMPAAEVGWGQLNADGVAQSLRLYSLSMDLEYRTPYISALGASNVASHIVRSLVQSATGNSMTGTLGTPSTKVILLVASDVNLAAFSSLLEINWLIPGYPLNYPSPGGALVFELRQSMSSGEYIIRTSYRAQTLDQLRNKTVLSLTTPLGIAPVFIPGCSSKTATFDCALADFVKMSKRAIDLKSADTVN